MALKESLIFAGALSIASCGTNGDRPGSTADASGTYVRAYAFEITNPESGKKVGIRQVRDSIFIERNDNGFEVSNRKWCMNDYDQEGWVNMEHADDRPLPSFVASYDPASGSLTSQNHNINESFFLDEDNVKLFRGQVHDIEYIKVP